MITDRRISVIIPCLNESAELQLTLQQLQPLRQAGHEVILVDGGSSDDTLVQAAGLADRVMQSSPGRARQMNLGATAASGSVFWFLHSDTRIYPEAVYAVIRCALIDGPGWGRFDVRLSGDQRSLRIVGFLMNLRSCLTGIATGDQAIFVRRSWFERIAGFPEIPLMEDIVLSRRLKRLARPCCVKPPVITSSRRWEQDGIFRTIILMWRLRLAFALGADPERLAQQYHLCNSPRVES